MGQRVLRKRVVVAAFLGAAMTAVWWVEAFRWSLAPTDGAKDTAPFLLILDPLILMVAGPVAILSGAVFCPLALEKLRDARFLPSVGFVVLAVFVEIAALTPLSIWLSLLGAYFAVPAALFLAPRLFAASHATATTSTLGTVE